jgi:hypothetical protein
MGCNCKKANNLLDKYGVEQEESILSKVNRTAWKLIVILIGFVLGIVLVPIVVVMAIYYQVFLGKPIKMPKWVVKYIK